MRIVNAFKIKISSSHEIEIRYQKTDPNLKDVFGQEKLETSLILPKETVHSVRELMGLNSQVSIVYFLEKTLRTYKGLDKILLVIRDHKLRYKLSAHTHC